MAVSHTHTRAHTHWHNTYTHINRKETSSIPDWTSSFCILILCSSKKRIRRDRQQEISLCYWMKTLSHFIFQDNYNSPCNCVGTAYSVSLFCTPIPRWHLRSLPSTLTGSTPFSFFRPSVSEFWICCMRWSNEEQTTRRKNVPKNNLTFNCIFVFALGLS